MNVIGDYVWGKSWNYRCICACMCSFAFYYGTKEAFLPNEKDLPITILVICMNAGVCLRRFFFYDSHGFWLSAGLSASILGSEGALVQMISWSGLKFGIDNIQYHDPENFWNKFGWT